MSDATPSPAPIEGKLLSDRAKHRLRIAAGLLRADGVKFDVPRDQFYETIQRVLSELAPDRQSALRSLVDWVEDYCRAEVVGNQASSASSSAKSRTTKGT